MALRPDGSFIDYAWNARNLLAGITADAPPPLATYTYNARNQVAATVIENGLFTATRSYDGAGRLIGVTNGALDSTGYTLSPDGRRTGISRNGETESYGYDNARQVTSASYQYDALGRRVKTSSLLSNIQSQIFYFYNGWNVELEHDGSDFTRRMTWGLDLVGLGGSPDRSLQGAGGVGGLVMVENLITNNSITNNPFFPTYDGNGNMTAWVNSSGTVVARQRYDAYGNIMQQTGTAPSNYGFSTKPMDQVTGLLYYGYRYYDPATGRWPSRDPIEEEGGINLYGFVGNETLDSYDLMGLADIDVSIKREYLENETIGTFAITSNDEKVNKCCGSVTGYTLELAKGVYNLRPYQSYDHSIKEYPIDEGPRKGDYSASPELSTNKWIEIHNKWAKENNQPLRPYYVGELGTHTINILNRSGRLKGTRMDAGTSALSSRGCPIVASKIIKTTYIVQGNKPGLRPNQHEGMILSLHVTDWVESKAKQLEIGYFVQCAMRQNDLK